MPTTLSSASGAQNSSLVRPANGSTRPLHERVICTRKITRRLSGRLEFSLPGDFTVGTDRAKPILASIVKPPSDSVRLHAGVNSPQLLQSESDVQLTFNNPAHFDFALWEAISGTRFHAGASNACHFLTVGSAGRVIVRDVLLWFQRGTAAQPIKTGSPELDRDSTNLNRNRGRAPSADWAAVAQCGGYG